MEYTYDKIVQTKYKALCQRSFKTRLELFLFDLLIKGTINQEFTVAEFLVFTISDELVKNYELSWQIEQLTVNKNTFDVNEIDKIYNEWNCINKILKEDLFKSYQPHFQEVVLTLDQFKEVFPEDSKHRICHYTHLSDYDFEILRKHGGIKTKNARGRSMEIDRLNSNKEYFKSNIVLCCYWANNAKMDEFTYPEFLEYVGPAMEQAFRNRINNK